MDENQTYTCPVCGETMYYDYSDNESKYVCSDCESELFVYGKK